MVRDDVPLIIEVAINGARSRAHNPHVPLTDEEIELDVVACLRAGASVVHAHAGQAVVGGVGGHDGKPYIEAFSRLVERYPGLIFYPTIPGGGADISMAQRFAHVAELADMGMLRLAPVDPGTMNYGALDANGSVPTHDRVYQTTFADVEFAFAFCRARALGCTMSIFEPGFLQLVLAHRQAGSLPPGSMVKFEFAARDRLFGLPPTPLSLQAYLAMFDGEPLPWMVNLREGDLAEGFGEAAISLGGHVRVGIEDYGGTRQPSNLELVSEIAALGRKLGRRPATADETAELIGLTA